jgi:hypothetical protein
MPEILDNWTVAQAWEHCYGSRPRPQPEDVSESALCEIDAVIASYFDDETTEGRKRAAAAIHYLEPRLLRSQLPPGPTERQRQHVAVIVGDCVEEYCDEDGLPRSCYEHLLRCLRRWELDQLDGDDWEIIYEALGTSGNNCADMLIWNFYKFAQSHVLYSDWS